MNIKNIVEKIGINAKEAARSLALLSTEKKNIALKTLYKNINKV